MGVTREGGQGKEAGPETMISRVGQRRAPGTLTQDTSSAEAPCLSDRSQPRGAPALHRRGRSGRAAEAHWRTLLRLELIREGAGSSTEPIMHLNSQLSRQVRPATRGVVVSSSARI